MNWSPPPPLLREITAWKEKATFPSSEFLMAVLHNDLCLAVSKATPEQGSYVSSLVRFLQSALPSTAWGSKGQCAIWRAAGGTQRVDRRRRGRK